MTGKNLAIVEIPDHKDPLERAAFYEARAAKFLNISIGGLRRLVAAGHVPAVTHAGGKNLLYRKADLLHYLESLRPAIVPVRESPAKTRKAQSDETADKGTPAPGA